MATKYHPNFVRGIGGNKLPQNTDLVIKIDGNPLYILGRLFVRSSWFRWKLIQIEQTGSPQNPQHDQITFEMVSYSKGEFKPMPPGKYKVSTYTYLTGIGGKRWTDEFEID